MAFRQLKEIIGGYIGEERRGPVILNANFEHRRIRVLSAQPLAILDVANVSSFGYPVSVYEHRRRLAHSISIGGQQKLQGGAFGDFLNSRHAHRQLTLV
jgi:hypothetical protein